MDMRGHGRSRGIRGHARGFAQLREDLARFVNSLGWRRSSPRFLYGHSLGGALALSVAREAPRAFDGIVSSAPALRPAKAPPAWKVLVARAMRGPLGALTVSNELDLSGLCRDAQVIQDYLTDPLVHDRISFALGRDLIADGERTLSAAESLVTPILVLHGDVDRLTSFQASGELAKRCPDRCTFAPFAGSFHELHNEPDRVRVFRVIESWLRDRSHESS